MITFSKLGTHGRLGNQLFQYALLKSVSLKTGKNIILDPEINNKVWHGQKCLLQNFRLESANYENIIFNNIYNEKEWMKYDESVFEIKDKTDFHGFFQNRRYFDDILPTIRDELEIKKEVKNKAIHFLNKFSGVKVSLHVRRGDNSDGTNLELQKITNDFSKDSILYNYYHRALELIPKESTILLFTGGSRNKNDNNSDIEWCKNNFKDKRIIYVEELNDIESFCCMTLCDYNILSFLSTFSLWVGYLNKNQQIIAPHKFYPHLNVNSKDLYLSNWEVIFNE